MGDVSCAHDDLTFQLNLILRASDAINDKDKKNAPSNDINKSIEYLQFLVATLFDNALPRMEPSTQVHLSPYLIVDIFVLANFKLFLL